MSNRVIRFGGSYIGYIDSVSSLTGYLQKEPGKTFVVVSAIPELLEWIEENLEKIFHSHPATDELNENLVSFFTGRVGGKQTTSKFIKRNCLNRRFFAGPERPGGYFCRETFRRNSAGTTQTYRN